MPADQATGMISIYGAGRTMSVFVCPGSLRQTVEDFWGQILSQTALLGYSATTVTRACQPTQRRGHRVHLCIFPCFIFYLFFFRQGGRGWSGEGWVEILRKIC